MGIPTYYFDHGTWIECELAAGPNDTFTRKGIAICDWDGKPRSFRARIADTFFSVPARMKLDNKTIAVCLSLDNGVLMAHKEKIDG